MTDQDTGQREVRGEVIDQNISILLHISSIILYRNKHKRLLDQPQHQHKNTLPCSLHVFLFVLVARKQLTENLRAIYNFLLSSLVRELRSDARGFLHYFLITSRVRFVLKCTLWTSRSSRWFFLFYSIHAMWNPLSTIHRAVWTQLQLNTTPYSHAV